MVFNKNKKKKKKSIQETILKSGTSETGVGSAIKEVTELPPSPKPKPVEEEPKIKKDLSPDIEFQGMTRPTGDLTPEQIEELRQRKALMQEREQQEILVAGGRASGEIARKRAEQQQSIGQIGDLGILQEGQEAPINFGQAATAGAAGAVPGIIGGAATGAAVGALGGPIGAVGGAVLGGVGTFVAGVLRNIKTQQSGELRASKIELTQARTNMRQLAMLASRDPANADIYIQQYNNQLTRVHQARRKTQLEVQGNLNSFMEDGREQLADFDAFLRAGGTADIYGMKLQASLQSGVPLSINGEELL